MLDAKTGHVEAVCANPAHGFSKHPQESIHLVEGLGVAGDAHMGATTQHRWLVVKDPKRKNLTQVHLLHAELFDELAPEAFLLSPGEMGENITTRGIELLGLPTGTKLHCGEAVIEVTGLREPCSQLNKLRPGLMNMLIKRHEDGTVDPRAGIMGIVLSGGIVRAGDCIEVELPPQPWMTMRMV